ncbi:Calcitonin receptor, partial [Frankliniella fusca]
ADHVFSGPEEQSRHIDEMHERCLAQGALDWNRTAVLGGLAQGVQGLAQGLAQGLGAELGWCPMAWDGLMCWNATPAASTAVQPCPAYIAGFDTQENATRRCLSDGTWFVNLTMNRTWTNYTMCHHGVATVVVSLPDSANSSLVAVSLS